MAKQDEKRYFQNRIMRAAICEGLETARARGLTKPADVELLVCGRIRAAFGENGIRIQGGGASK